MQQPPQAQVNISINVGGRPYEFRAPADIHRLLERLEDPQVHILELAVRGLKLAFRVDTHSMLWTAGCLEQIEPELLDWIDTLERKSVFYDIGASTGPFALYAAARGLRVIAIEPEAQNYALLEMNHFLNRARFLHPITTLNAAISDEYGLGKIYCANYIAGAHEKILDAPKPVLGEGKEFTPQHIQTVVKYPLDKIIRDCKLPAPSYLKIDVDGAEAKLIEGARETLASPALKELYIELEARTEAPIIAKLESHGFTQRMKKQVENYSGLHNYIFARAQ